MSSESIRSIQSSKSVILLPGRKSALQTNKVFFNLIKYLFTDYSDDSKFSVPPPPHPEAKAMPHEIVTVLGRQ